MKELYFVNNNKEGYTWNQLLYWCYRNIGETRRSYEIENFFSNFRHNDNDGNYKKGYWKQNTHWEYIQQKDEKGRLTSEWIKTLFFDNWTWIPETLTPKKWQITDSYNRIIPSSLIKNSYLKYIPNEKDEKITKSSSMYWNKYFGILKGYKYRKGPVPGIHKYNSWHGSKFAGKHCGITPWKREWYKGLYDAKEAKLEYNININLPDKIVHFYGKSKGRTWKRSKIKKQWMRRLK